MRILTLTIVGWLFLGLTCHAVQAEKPPKANVSAAQEYLEQRAKWWLAWEPAAREVGGACQSCHTTVPFVLAQAALNGKSAYWHAVTADKNPYEKIVASALTRVRKWPELAPEGDASEEAVRGRATESVLNLFMVAEHASAAGRSQPSDDTRQVVRNLWEQQIKEGPASGAWEWFEFKLAPWEANAQYWGAALAAYSLGKLPGYLSDPPPDDQANVARLKAYRGENFAKQSLHHQLAAVWASTQFPNLLTQEQKQSTIEAVLALQQADGGWSTGGLLGDWKTHDDKPLPTASDGYGTAVVVASLQGVAHGEVKAALEKGLAWLHSHQDPDGSWPAESPNTARGEDDPARLFLRDAATGWAVRALSP